MVAEFFQFFVQFFADALRIRGDFRQWELARDDGLQVAVLTYFQEADQRLAGF